MELLQSAEVAIAELLVAWIHEIYQLLSLFSARTDASLHSVAFKASRVCYRWSRSAVSEGDNRRAFGEGIGLQWQQHRPCCRQSV